MAGLHTALKALSPTAFSSLPTSPDDLDSYLTSLFGDCQTILESIPILPPDDSQHARSRAQTGASTASFASSASEMSASSARSPEPPAEYKDLQKEWGKPIKLSAKENPLGVSVYKTSGKDGRGAWFARRSVHEGLGFAKFKRGLQREFPESLEFGGGKPGEGNIRGIGGERKVEDIGVKGRGRVQVWQLSAQFPGPTTPRDFVTLLITSSRAMKSYETRHENEVPDEIQARHHMIISRPCEHNDAKPRSGYIRGQYESVEFIREVIRHPSTKSSPSSSRFDMQSNHGPAHEASLEREMLKHNVHKKTHTFPLHHENRSAEELPEHGHLHTSSSGDLRASDSDTRKRSITVGTPQEAAHAHDQQNEHYDPEENPVEWIMITRSDPGGNVPRFMVERGTPASIVADAGKFLDWACQKDDPRPGEELHTPSSEMPPPLRTRRMESFSSLQANGTLAGVSETESETEAFPAMDERNEEGSSKSSVTSIRSNPTSGNHDLEHPGIVAAATGAFAAAVEAYAPKMVSDHLPPGLATPKAKPSSPALLNKHEDSHISTASTLHPETPADDDDESDVSSLSFASAESHHISDDDASKNQSLSSLSSPEKDRSEVRKTKSSDPVEKEHANFEKRRQTLDKKLEEVRTKYPTTISDSVDETAMAKNSEKVKKAEEKHKKELEKEEERYRKSLAKIDEKKKKDAKREEEKIKKERDKDEMAKLRRERDEAVERVKVLERQVEMLSRQVGDLQRENTGLVAKFGGNVPTAPTGDGTVERSRDVKRVLGENDAGRLRSRSSSLRRMKGVVSGEGA